MVIHASNSITQEVGKRAAGLDQPGLHSKNLSQKEEKEQEFKRFYNRVHAEGGSGVPVFAV